jgi:PAS domain S-box-containing protein/putative nucleotidyltransferase with HDIG domain
MRIKLAHRMSLFIGCILLIGIGAIAYETIHSNILMMQEIGKSESERLSQVVFDGLYSSMRTGGGRAENQAILKRLRKIEGIEDLRIIHGAKIDRQYGVQADETPVDEHDRAALEGKTVSFIEDGGFGSARFVRPVFVVQECRSCHMAGVGDVNGAISIRISLKKYQSLFAQQTRDSLFIGGVVLLVIFITIFLLVRRRVLEPIGKIAVGVKALERGDLNHQLKIATGDELEDVGNAFDHMSASLHAKTAELKYLLDRYSKLVESAIDAVMLHDLETNRLIEVNPQTESITGYSRDELLQMSAEELHPEGRLGEYNKAIHEWKNTGKGYLHDTLIRRKDGSTIPVEIAASMVELDGSKFLQEIWRDLTERKGFEATIKRYAEELEDLVANRTQELRKSEEKYRRLVEFSPDSIGVQRNGKWIYVNPAAIKLFGGNRAEDLIGEPVLNLVHPDSRKIVINRMRKEFEEGKSAQFMEEKLLRLDGQPFDAEVSASRIDFEGKPATIVIARDITGRKTAEKNKERAYHIQRVLGDILGISLHPGTMRETLIRCLDAILASSSTFSFLNKGAIFLTAGSENELELIVHRGLPESLQLKCVRLPFGQCLCGQAASSREIIFANHVDERHENRYEGMQNHGHYCVPIVSKNKVLGVFNTYLPADYEKNDEDIQFLGMVADTLGLAIESKQAEVELEKGREQLRISLIGTIVAISKAVGARDPYTAGHQQRVSQLARAIAQEMGLDKERIDGLRMGAIIHDIGKINVPAEFLTKPTRLTKGEFEIIKTHPEVGYEILKDIEFPWPVAEIAHQHHERLDGSGYPQGLKGSEIVYEAKIVAVADVVEAMSSHRPYRPGLGIDMALKEIEDHRGTFYDPDVVDICLDLFRSGKFSFSSL